MEYSINRNKSNGKLKFSEFLLEARLMPFRTFSGAKSIFRYTSYCSRSLSAPLAICRFPKSSVSWGSLLPAGGESKWDYNRTESALSKATGRSLRKFRDVSGLRNSCKCHWCLDVQDWHTFRICICSRGKSYTLLVNASATVQTARSSQALAIDGTRLFFHDFNIITTADI